MYVCTHYNLIHNIISPKLHGTKIRHHGEHLDIDLLCHRDAENIAGILWILVVACQTVFLQDFPPQELDVAEPVVAVGTYLFVIPICPCRRTNLCRPPSTP